jgi:hypothetical protein
MIQKLLLFLGLPREGVRGRGCAGRASFFAESSLRWTAPGAPVTEGQDRLRSSGVQQFFRGTLSFTLTAVLPAYFAFSAMKIISRERSGSNDPALHPPNTSRTTSPERLINSWTRSREGNLSLLSVVSVPPGI